MRELRELLWVGALELLPSSRARKRLAAAFRGEAPLNNGTGWCVAYAVTRGLRNAVFSVAR